MPQFTGVRTAHVCWNNGGVAILRRILGLVFRSSAL